MGIELEAIEPHAHYDPHGTRIDHAPGDRYTVDDGGGWTANQIAAAFIAAGLAKRIDKSQPKPTKAAR